MVRPALKRLMVEIVAYKVDRLSRLLLDFSNMVEVFDKHNVSFISVSRWRVSVSLSRSPSRVNSRRSNGFV
jgi:DNA invertase Pin-like site-specific DNA recombinase